MDNATNITSTTGMDSWVTWSLDHDALNYEEQDLDTDGQDW